MFYTQNTQELRRGLEELGYSHGKPKYYADDDNKYDFIMCHNGIFFLLSQKNHVIRNGHPLKNMEVLIAERMKNYSWLSLH